MCHCVPQADHTGGDDELVDELLRTWPQGDRRGDNDAGPLDLDGERRGGGGRAGPVDGRGDVDREVVAGGVARHDLGVRTRQAHVVPELEVDRTPDALQPAADVCSGQEQSAV